MNEDIASDLKRRAKRAGISVSALVMRELTSKSVPAAWPKDFFEKRCGFLREDIRIDDLPAEPVEL